MRWIRHFSDARSRQSMEKLELRYDGITTYSKAKRRSRANANADKYSGYIQLSDTRGNICVWEHGIY